MNKTLIATIVLTIGLMPVTANALIDVEIDVMPGSCPNPVNLSGEGVLTIAILGTEEFDVTQIDPESFELASVVATSTVEPLEWDIDDVATPFDGELCDCHTEGPDGFLDLTLKFDYHEVVETLGLAVMAGETIPLILSGSLFEVFGGDSILGVDCAEIGTEPSGGEGCTPGFWVNNARKHGAAAWCDAYSPSDRFSDHFSLIETLEIRGKGKRTITNPTLLQALEANGGGVNAMVRHGVAAMLNACIDCVNYEISGPEQVISMIENTLNGAPGAYTVDELHSMFASYNEAGNPVNHQGDCVGAEEEIDE